MPQNQNKIIANRDSLKTIQNSMDQLKFYPPVYKHIEHLINMLVRNDESALVSGKILLIKDSIGSELYKFIDTIITKKDLSNLVIDLNEVYKEFLRNKNIIYESEINIVAKIINFIESNGNNDPIENRKRNAKKLEGSSANEGQIKSNKTDFDNNSNRGKIKKEVPKDLNHNKETNDKGLNNKDGSSQIASTTPENLQGSNKANNSGDNSVNNNILKIIWVKNIQLIRKNETNIVSSIIEEYRQISGVYNNKVSILFLIADENAVIPREIMNEIDYVYNIPRPNRSERLEIMNNFLRAKNIFSVDVSEVVDYTEDWNVLDLKRLIDAAYLKWRLINLELMETKNNQDGEQIEENKDNEENKENKDNKDKANNGNNENKSSEPQLKDDGNVSNDNPLDNDKIEDNNKKDEPKAKKTKSKTTKSKTTKSKNKGAKTIDTYLSKRKNRYIVPMTADLIKELITSGEIYPLSSYPSKSIIEMASENNFTNNLILSNKIVSNNIMSSNPYNQNAGLGFNPNLNQNDPFSKNKSYDYNYDRKNTKDLKNEATLLSGININELNSFTSNQLYQFAASTKFDELVTVLEKLANNLALDDLDRKTLSDFPFVLKDPPKKALVLLNNAKTRVDRLKKMFNS